jgi:hypothetical protein
MPTPAQFTTLVAALRASVDSTVVNALAIGNNVALTDWCNAAAAGPVKAWSTSALAQDIDEACDWTQFDTIQAGKRDSWGFFLALPTRDFTKNKVRKWVTDVWGNATGSLPAVAILQAATFNASNAENILGGTTRTTGDVSALELNWTGTIVREDLSLALIRNP